jgi:microcystin-dependent protein
MRFTIFGGIIAGTAAITTLTYQPGPAKACNMEGYLGSICWTAIDYCPEGYLPADGRMLEKRTYDFLWMVIKDAYGSYTREYTIKVNEPPADKWIKINKSWKIWNPDYPTFRWYDPETKKLHSDEEVKTKEVTVKDEYFLLPDLRAREPVGTGAGRELRPISNGQKIGDATQGTLLEVIQMPEHDHGINLMVNDAEIKAQDNSATERTPSGNVFAAPEKPGILRYSNTENGAMAPGVVTANIAGAEITSGIARKPGSNATSVAQEYVDLYPPQLGMLACINVGGEFTTRPTNKDDKADATGATTP